LKIGFRVDSSELIGAGHVVRCIALAQEMKKRNIEIFFISYNNLPFLKQYILSQGFDLFEISEINKTKINWNKDLEKTLNVLEEVSLDALIVDHYALGLGWLSGIKEKIEKLVVIDDMPGRKVVCDILIDQNLGREAKHYSSFIEDKTKLILGKEFVLTRQEFKENRARALKKREEFSGIKSILLSLGGSEDPRNYLRIINNISKSEIDSLSQVTLAPGFLDSPETIFKDLTRHSSLKVEILSNPLDILEAMIKADISIGYAGSSSWERCILGLPTLVKAVSKNQLFIAESLKKEGVAKIWNNEKDLRNLILEMNIEDNWYKAVSASKNICDGNGSRRVVDAILE
tara:strand:- start:6825 stop:7859 length:1035 start_codon:yes stop_codon:yes gene_type:complete